MRSIPLVLVCVAALAGLARPAAAELEAGEAAPPLGPLECVQGRVPPLEALRGRVVLLEFFSTACRHCQAHVPSLDAWHARYARRGLVVVGVTRDEASAVRAFQVAHRPHYALAVAGVDLQRAHLVRSYPEACLVDAFGDVAWAGPATQLPEDVLLAQLERALPPPALPAGLAWAQALREAGRQGEVRRGLARLRDCRLDAQPECAPARDTLAWLDAYGAARLAAAAELRVLQRPYDAWRALIEVATGYDGEPEAERARRALAALLREERAAREVAAGRALAGAIAAARQLPSAQATAVYERLAAAWRGTQAAARATRRAARLRPAGR